MKAFPDLKDIVDVHLSDADGTPIHAVANGWYFLENGEIDKMSRCLRVNEDEANRIVLECATKESFAEYVEKNLKPRWEKNVKSVMEHHGLCMPRNPNIIKVNLAPKGNSKASEMAR